MQALYIIKYVINNTFTFLEICRNASNGSYTMEGSGGDACSKLGKKPRHFVTW